MPPGNLTTSAYALLAFLVAFYTLQARERKTPYIITFIYPIAFLIILAIGAALAAPLLEHSNPTASRIVAWVAFGFLCLGLITAFHNVWKLQNRHVHFRDDNLIKNLAPYRKGKDLLRRMRRTRSYEHTPPQNLHFDALSSALSPGGSAFVSEVRSAIASCLSNTNPNSLSLAICGRRLIESDLLISKLIEHLLDQAWYIQYTTCIRNPYELAHKLSLKDQAYASKVAIIDAYTPHFGFTDSIHRKLTTDLTAQGFHLITSPASYAGVHTATAKAFNTLKTHAGKEFRRPTLVIYEGCNALVDLESSPQYRIFIRHVLPSERAWGGMLTLFVEPTISDADMNLLETYSDAFIGPANSRAKDSEGGEDVDA